MNTKLSGLALVALAALGAGFWFLRRQHTADISGATDTAAAATAKANLPSGSSFGQVGSNFAENITPEIVKLTLGFAAATERRNGPCWARSDIIKNDGSRVWFLRQPGAAAALMEAHLINGTIPTTDLYPVCG